MSFLLTEARYKVEHPNIVPQETRRALHDSYMESYPPVTSNNEDHQYALYELWRQHIGTEWKDWAGEEGCISHGLTINSLYRDVFTPEQFTKMSKLRRYINLNLCWAIPAPATIEYIKSLNLPIVEIGAGSGYFGGLIKNRGVDIVMVDDNSDDFYGQNPGIIKQEGVEYLSSHDGCADRALFLCWAREDWIDQVLVAFRGDTVIWIGELSYLDPHDGLEDGCTGHLHNKSGWREEARRHIPTWPGMHDLLIVYKRRSD